MENNDTFEKDSQKSLQEVGEKTTDISYFQQKYGEKVIQQITFTPDNQKQKELLDFFDTHLVGQKHAKKILSEVIVSALYSCFQKKGPISTLFFHGPTGVGKTDIAHILSKFLFGDDQSILKIKCEQFSQDHEGSVFKGAPPGYLGFDKAPRFTQEILDSFYFDAKNRGKLHPMIASIPGFNIVVLDEVEKMHPSIYKEFLGILDDGLAVTHNGKLVDFSNTIFIFTSNIAQKEIKELSGKNSIGFVPQDTSSDKKQILKKAFEEKFSPEFLGRIHHFVEFDSLSLDDAKQILDIQLKKLNSDIEKYYKERPNLSVDISPTLRDLVLNSGFSGEAGARDLVRTFEKSISHKLSEFFISDSFQAIMNSSNPVVVGLDGNTLDDIQFFIIESEKTKLEHILVQKIPLGLDSIEILLGKMSQFTEYFYLQETEGVDFSQEMSELKKDFIQMGIASSEIDNLKSKTYLKILYENQFMHDFGGILNYAESGDFAPFSIQDIKKIVEHKLKVLVPEKKKHIFSNDIEKFCTEIFRLLCRILKVERLTTGQQQFLFTLIQKHLQEKFHTTLIES